MFASLRPIDIEFMRRLHTKVNLIPVIAKADTLTDDEIANFKARVCTKCVFILLYFSTYLCTDRYWLISLFITYISTRLQHMKMKMKKQLQRLKRLLYVLQIYHVFFTAYVYCVQSKIPFAVVGSDQIVNAPDGRSVRGRAYPWGVIEVDNEEHCDFVKLRQMLVRTYMEELREHTNLVLYENWRSDKLMAMGVQQDFSVFQEIKSVKFLLV